VSALIQDTKRDSLGGPQHPIPPRLGFPVEANTQLFGGGLGAVNAAGNAVRPQTPGALYCPGVVYAGQNNLSTNVPYGAAGALIVEMQVGAFPFATDGSIPAGALYLSVYGVDDATISADDGGGTRPYAGYTIQNPLLGGANANNANAKVYVMVGFPNPYASAADGGPPAFKVRAVVTALPGTYTGSGLGTLTAAANGAITSGDADGVTLAANDVVLLEEGATNIVGALDGGPMLVVNPGASGAPYQLKRLPWWMTGAEMALGQSIEVGGEGTFYAGTRWKSFAAKGSVVDTTAPSLYPDKVTQKVTLATGFATVTNVPIRSLTESGLHFQPTSFSGAGLTVSYRTGAYASGGAATAAGHLGTASASITALVAAGTFETSDISTGLLTITN
jgi:hypothetical protein